MAKKKKIGHWTMGDYINVFFLVLIAFVTFYPFWNVLMISLNDPNDTLMGGITLWIRKFTIENYRYIFTQNAFTSALIVSVGRTSIGAAAHLLFCSAFAYALSKKWMIGQKFFLGMLIVTMYIGGGLIPTFLTFKNLGLYHNFMVYILPNIVSSYNAIIMMTYFKSIPSELEESVRIDGGNDYVIFFRIVLPVSLPMLATIGLFVAVWQWNSWFDTMLYGGRKLMTLQMQLVELIRDASQVHKLMSAGSNLAANLARMGYNPNVESIKATSMMVTAIPIICVYPFLQKYFVKGIMVGSLKG